MRGSRWILFGFASCWAACTAPVPAASAPAQVQAGRSKLTGGVGFDAAPYVRTEPRLPDFEGLRARARQKGDRLRIIVGLKTPWQPEGRLGAGAAAAQRTAVRGDQLALEGRLAGTGRHVNVRRRYDVLPYVTLVVNEATLDALAADPAVRSVREDALSAPSLENANHTVSAMESLSEPLGKVSGAGTVVAVLDTGVDDGNPMLDDGKVVAEACFADDIGQGWSEGGDCPNHSYEQIGPGSAVPCGDMENEITTGGCSHGTHVAGIAVGRAVNTTVSGVGFHLRGIAPDAQLIAINVFHLEKDDACGASGARCTRTYTSDQLKGLEHVFLLRSSFNIAAVNMSLGGGSYGSNCDDQEADRADAIDLLRSVGVATVVSAGNEGSQDGIGAPACISTAIAVGSVNADGVVAGSSNWTPLLDFAAQGVGVLSAIPTDYVGGAWVSFDWKSGTSMAAPQVAGAFALLRQLIPAGPSAAQGNVADGASVSDLRTLLRAKGEPIADRRPGTIGVAPGPFNQTPNAGFTVPLLSLTEVLSGLAGRSAYVDSLGRADAVSLLDRWNRAHQFVSFGVRAKEDDADTQYLRVMRTERTGGRQGVQHVSQIDAAGQGCGIGWKPKGAWFDQYDVDFAEYLYSQCVPSGSDLANVWVRPEGAWREGNFGRLQGASLYADVDDAAALFGSTLRVSRSWSTAGTVNSVNKLGVGDYEVVLPDLAGTGELIHVTPYLNADSTGAAVMVGCHVGTRTNVGATLKVRVNCFVVATGDAIDSGFSFSMTRLGAVLPPGVNAALDANQPTTVSYTPAISRNLSGQANTITRTSVGNYTVRLRGLVDVDPGVAIVTAYGTPATARCWQKAAPTLDGADRLVFVRCTADTRFALTWFGADNAPKNDDIFMAEELTGPVGSVTGENWGATSEATEPYHMGYLPGPSVWYEWKAPESGPVRFSTRGSTFDTMIRLYDGDFTKGPVSAVGGSDEYGGTEQSLLTANVVAGKTYFLVVSSPSKTGKQWYGRIALEWACNPPANDLESAATALAGSSGTELAANARALGEPGEWQHAGLPPESTRWFKFTPVGRDGTLALSTASSTVDTVLAVYGPGLLGTVRLGFSDDANGTPQSFLKVSVKAGVTYSVVVGGKGGSRGSIPLQYSFVPPSNDDFADATVLDPGLAKVTSTSNNVRATSEPGEPLHAGAPARTSVWWRWTAAASGTASVDTYGSVADTALAVYTGTSPSALTLVAANADAVHTTASQVTFQAHAGVTYFIAVTSEAPQLMGPQTTGDITLHRVFVP